MKSEGYYMDKLNIDEIENVAGGTFYDGLDIEGDDDSDDMENFGNDYYGFINDNPLKEAIKIPNAKKEKGIYKKIKIKTR